MRKHRFIGFVLTAATVVGPLTWLATTPAKAAVVMSDGAVSWRLPQISTPPSLHQALPWPGSVTATTTPVTELLSQFATVLPHSLEGGQAEQARLIERQASVQLNEALIGAYAAALARLAAQEAAQQPSTQRATDAPIISPTPTPPAAASGDVWAELRDCESGGNYAEDTGNGFYGAYQFAPSTWSALGYPGLPNEAAPAVQDAAAQQLQSRSGWGQWPGCSAKLGL
jgi:hypothetical protein